jgi:hypothetical protein
MHELCNLDDPRDVERSARALMEARGFAWDRAPQWATYPMVPAGSVRVLQGRICGDGKTEFVEASDDLGFWRDVRNRVLDWDKPRG